VKFLLDSNAVVAILKGGADIRERLRRYEPDDFGIPAVVAHELFYGAYKSARMAENLARVEALQFEVVNFDRDDARKAGELRARLAVAGAPIGPYDVLIAGQALSRSLRLVTHNTREFARVPKLRIEDWE